MATLDRPCVLDAAGQPSNTGQLCRGVPDVAALSGDVVSNGYTIVSDDRDSGGGWHEPVRAVVGGHVGARRRLPRGSYKVSVRGVDAAANRERTGRGNSRRVRVR